MSDRECFAIHAPPSERDTRPSNQLSHENEVGIDETLDR